MVSSMQADTVLEKELRVLCFDLQATESLSCSRHRLSLGYFNVHPASHSIRVPFLKKKSSQKPSDYRWNLRPCAGKTYNPGFHPQVNKQHFRHHSTNLQIILGSPRAQGLQKGRQKALYILRMQALGEVLGRGVWVGENISPMTLKYTYGNQTADTPCGCQQ